MHFLFSSNHLSFDHSHQSPWLRTLGFQTSIITRWLRFRELSGIGYRDSFAWSKDFKISVCLSFRPICLHRLVPFWCFSYHLPLACHCRIDPMPPFECLLSFYPGVCGNRGNGHEREGLVISMNTYSASIQLCYVPFLFSPLTAVGVASFFFRCCINSASNALAECFALISDEFYLHHHHHHQPSYHPRNTL